MEIYAWAVLRRAALTAVMLLAGAASAAGQPPLARLPALGLQRDAVTVSGLSSGGYMAGQFQIAYSASIAGAAVLAGGPYGCSRGSLSTAMFNCSCPAEKSLAVSAAEPFGGGCQLFAPDVYLSFSERATRGNKGEIDDVSHLAGHRIWLFSGGEDHVVDRRMVDVVESYYRSAGVPAAQIEHIDLPNAGHGFPSPQAKLACNLTQTPFLTDCDLDAAGDLLKWLYPGAVPAAAAAPKPASLKSFQQTRYTTGIAFSGLDSSGWLYVPAACEKAGAQCKLHVVFHGCQQGQNFVVDGKPFGKAFVEKTGYNGWAEAAGIVVLYPQVKPSTEGSFFSPYRYNPKGCWDFWGYTEKYAALSSTAPNFAKRSAPQLRAVKGMIDDLLRGR